MPCINCISFNAFVCPTEWCVSGFYSNAPETGPMAHQSRPPWAQDIFANPANFSGSPSFTYKKEIQFL